VRKLEFCLACNSSPKTSVCCFSDFVQVSARLVVRCFGRSGFIFPDLILIDFIMSCSDSFGVRFTGKNYSTWKFQFRLFVMSKELWGQIDGSDPEPTEPKELAKWKVKDARVMSWILGSVDPLIVLNLRAYRTAKTMWEYLLKVYHQDNTARRFQLEYEIASFTQGNLSIQEYFSGFQNL
jgi:hypothetical protein